MTDPNPTPDVDLRIRVHRSFRGQSNEDAEALALSLVDRVEQAEALTCYATRWTDYTLLLCDLPEGHGDDHEDASFGSWPNTAHEEPSP